MTFRMFIFWVVGIAVVGAVAYFGYLYLVHPSTTKVNIEASFDGTAQLAIPRSGVIAEYNDQTNQLSFYGAENGELELVIVDESTIIRTLKDGTYIDGNLELLQPGRLVTINLESATPSSAAGAVDVVEVQQ